MCCFCDGFGPFLANSGHFYGRGATLWCRILFSSPSNFTQNHFLKIEWLFADITPVRSPDRAEPDILGMILAGRFLGNSGRVCEMCGTTYRTTYASFPFYAYVVYFVYVDPHIFTQTPNLS